MKTFTLSNLSVDWNASNPATVGTFVDGADVPTFTLTNSSVDWNASNPTTVGTFQSAAPTVTTGGTRPWLPTDLTSGTAIEFDTTVATSFGGSSTPANGATVSTFYSKSGSLTAAPTSGSQPTYSSTGFNNAYPALIFNGGQNLVTTTALAQGPNYFAIAVVAPTDIGAAGVGSILDADDLSDNDRIAQYIRFNGQNAENISFDSNNNYFIQDIATSTTPQIIAFNHATSLLTGQLNGGNTTTSTPSGTGQSGTRQLAIGAWLNNPSSQNLHGALAYAALVPTASLTQDEFDRYTGYLAWKFGLQGVLPANHPYKNAAPIVAAAVATVRRRYSMLIAS